MIVSPAVSLALVSLPELVVGVLSLLVWWTSLALEPRRREERAVLGAYRGLALVTALVMGLALLHHNGGGPTAARLALAALAGFLPALGGFVAAVEDRPTRSRALWGLWGLVGLAFALDRGLLVAGVRPVGAGHSLAAPGPLLAPYLALVVAGGALGVARLLARARTAVRMPALGRSWPFGAAGVALLAAGGLDALGVLGVHGGPPLLWAGALAVILTFSGAVGRLYRATYRWASAVEQEREDLAQQLIRDHLTGLYTRAYGQSVLERALAGRGACVVFVDLDDFKSWNDRFGHATGDRVLKAVADVVRGSARAEDTAARYAGDEFFVVLPTARLEAGLRVGEGIRQGLAAIAMRDGGRVTASIGVARGELGESAESLLDRADRAAYRAKRDGKNRVSSTQTTF